MNVGASAPEEAGQYFSWGNTDGHTPGDGYEFTKARYNNTPGVEISGDIPLSQDAARFNMGGSWRMPTRAEIEELFNNAYTTKEWVTNYQGSGVNGYLVTSKVNGNKLFFPAAGYFNGNYRDYGSILHYWTSSISSSDNAYCLIYGAEGYLDNVNLRFIGSSVRAVQ